MKKQTTTTTKTTTVNALHQSLLRDKRVKIITIKYRSELRNMISKRDGNPLGKVFEIQFCNLMIGASYLKRRNKIALSLGLEPKEVSELTWGTLSDNRKVRYNSSGEASIHGFRIGKVHKSEGYFENEKGERIDRDTVAKWRKSLDPSLTVEDIQKLPLEEQEAHFEKLVSDRVAWRAYKLSNILEFRINGTTFVVE